MVFLGNQQASTASFSHFIGIKVFVNFWAKLPITFVNLHITCTTLWSNTFYPYEQNNNE